MAEPSNARESRWYFNAEQLQNSPSRKSGIDADKELQYRQQTAYLIQEMGQYLRVSQLCINTAIVYMHRFYAFHSFTHFHRNGIAAASLFLAAKVEEQPRKLEHVIKVANASLNEAELTKELFTEQAHDLVFNENVLLQTLGFDVAIDHPHTHVVKTCHLVQAGKDLAQTSYFMASNSLHLTTMCLQYKPTVVACFCIHLACKWSSWEIPNSTEGRPWFHYVDKSVTTDLLNQLTEEFIQIYQKSPSRLKNKLNSIKALVQGTKPEDSPQPMQKASVGNTNNGGGNSTNSSGGQQGHRSSSSSGHHHHHHHHHHHTTKAFSQGSERAPSQSASQSVGGGHQQDASGGVVKMPKAYNNHSSSSSGSNRPRSDSKGHATNPGGVAQQGNSAISGHRSSSSGGGAMSGQSGMHNSSNPNGGGSRQPRPAPPSSSSSSMPQQQQTSQAPSMNKNSSSSNSQKYGQPPSYGDNAMTGQGSRSNSPSIATVTAARQGGTSGGAKPLFVNSFQQQQQQQQEGGKQKQTSLLEDAFQFSIDDLRDGDSQDSNQAQRNQKLQSIFCPDWKEDYTSGNTEHAKMNLPIGSTGDTKAPPSMMAGKRSEAGSGGSNSGGQQHQRLPQQKQGGSSSSSSSGGGAGTMAGASSSSSAAATGGNMRKPEKKPEQPRIHPFAGNTSSNPNTTSSLTNINSSISTGANLTAGSGGGGGGLAPSVSQSGHNPGKVSSKRPYEEMMTPIGGGVDMSTGGGGGVGMAGGQDYRDAKIRRSDVEMGGPTTTGAVGSGFDPMGVRERQKPIEKDFNDYRDVKPILPLANITTTTTTIGLGSNSSTSATSKFSSYSNSAHSIETNPDLVSSLLKESLKEEQSKPFTTIPVAATTGGNGSASSLLAGDRYNTMNNGVVGVGGGLSKAGGGVGMFGNSLESSGGAAASTVSTSQLDQLINAPPQPFQQIKLGNPIKMNGAEGQGLATTPAADGSSEGGDDGYRHKSEKKKKKEKHKNKDKEKSKDRGSKEERKKHKKDKERHKDRHHYSSHDEEAAATGGVLGPIKLKIPKLEPGIGGGAASYESDAVGGSFKIKIPRNPEQLVPLKIKISKDKLMTKEAVEGLGMVDTIKAEGGGRVAYDEGGYMGYSGGASGGHLKKKDKDKLSKRDY